MDVFAVAGVALGGEDGFDVFFVVDFDGCGGRERRLSGEGEEGCQEEGGAHARTIRSRILSRVKGGDGDANIFCGSAEMTQEVAR